MKLLGTYSSEIPDWYYKELLALVNKSISSGDYAGGFTYDQTAVNALKSDSQTFAELGLPTAGLRAIDEDFNYPISVLDARFVATSKEVASLTDTVSNLISLLNKESNLLDQTLYRSTLNNWVQTLPTVPESTNFAWNFGVGIGRLATNITSDYHGFTYPFTLSHNKLYYVADETIHRGIISNTDLTLYKPKELNWIYESEGLDNLQTGTDWAELDFLEDKILFNYLDPQVDILLPNNAVSSPVTISGQSVTFGIPISVKTFFKPRYNSTTITTPISTLVYNQEFSINPNDTIHIKANIINTAAGGSATLYVEYYDINDVLIPNYQNIVGSVTETGVVQNTITVPAIPNIITGKLRLDFSTGTYELAEVVDVNTPIRLLNGYTIDPTSVNVYNSSNYYSLYSDFQADGNGNVTLINVPDATVVTISYNENYPAYQSSIGGVNWSRTIMFDSIRPYPDDESSFSQIPIGIDSNAIRSKLPILDELDNPTGLYIALNSNMNTDYLLTVYQDPDPSTSGKTANLVISFPQTSYMNQLTLSPYTNFPVIIKSITATGFIESDVSTIFTGELLLDEKTTIIFDTVLANKITVNFLQQNYSIKQHQIQPDDYIRRDAINSLQSIVPNTGRNDFVLPQVIFVNGFQYEFGIEQITAGYSSNPTTSVVTSGPFNLLYKPEIVTFYTQASINGSTYSYLLFEAFDSGGNLIDSNYTTATQLLNSKSLIIPFNPGTSTNITSVKLYIKHVLTAPTSYIDTFLLQVK